MNGLFVDADILRGVIALAAVFSTLVSLGAFFYSRPFSFEVSTSPYRVAVIRSMRKLVALNVAALAILAGCYFVRFFYADPRSRLTPDFVFYSDALTYYIGLFHIAFPALVLFYMVREAKRAERKGE